jgi:hypothetical protein
MDYELAKQLKAAGFPQKGDWWFRKYYDGEIGKINAHRDIPAKEDAYSPTLSELVEACGEEFYYLRKTTNWFASALFDSTDIREVWGDTPEEAVAKLWLALNKK